MAWRGDVPPAGIEGWWALWAEFKSEATRQIKRTLTLLLVHTSHATRLVASLASKGAI
jgi:hypothetical protein